MYKILGPDRNEYGPVDAAQLRQWLAEGRVNRQSLAREENSIDWKPVAAFAELNVTAPPPMIVTHPYANKPSNDSLSTIIPYKNPPALIAYYLGIFSFIPLLGLLLGVAALVLGIMGLNRAAQDPQARGRVHAWIGIIVGGFFALLYAVAAILMLVAAVGR
jgi:hypothetical protein